MALMLATFSSRSMRSKQCACVGRVGGGMEATVAAVKQFELH